MDINKIKEFIPHREPFLFVDKILDHSEDHINSEITFDQRHGFLDGHFPGNPIVPGVILCEAVFQTSAVLMGLIGDSKNTPIVTRIENCKFKNMAKPNDLVSIKVKLEESLANAFFLNAKVSVDSKTVLQIKFRCAHV